MKLKKLGLLGLIGLGFLVGCASTRQEVGLENLPVPTQVYDPAGGKIKEASVEEKYPDSKGLPRLAIVKVVSEVKGKQREICAYHGYADGKINPDAFYFNEK